VEHTTVKSKEEVANYIELINKLIRELDHTVEKLESMKS
jgi:predicted house-cleaning noncanonical NTP pyrophosphatase (MazG superfamily)